MPRYLAITATSFLVAATLVIAQGHEPANEQLNKQLYVGDWATAQAEDKPSDGIVPILRFTSMDDVARESVSRLGGYAEACHPSALPSSA